MGDGPGRTWGSTDPGEGVTCLSVTWSTNRTSHNECDTSAERVRFGSGRDGSPNR